LRACQKVQAWQGLPYRLWMQSSPQRIWVCGFVRRCLDNHVAVGPHDQLRAAVARGGPADAEAGTVSVRFECIERVSRAFDSMF
jgi:hypothetical protein